MIFDAFAIRAIPSYLAQGHTVISLRKTTVNGKLVAACHEQGLQVYAWTVDEEDEMRNFIALGVDGIYSNRPGVLKKVIDERGR
jgi:glycerophosphoryl diester phosphodiesterase